MLHPSVLRKIVDKAPIKEDAAWGKILKHNHFSRATMGGPSLEHLINIYIERNFLVWRAPDVQAWLKKGAQSVVDIADRQAQAKDGGEIANWACVRKEAFPADQNEYVPLIHEPCFPHSFIDGVSELLQNLTNSGTAQDKSVALLVVSHLNGSV